jgi:hypothetical protein
MAASWAQGSPPDNAQEFVRTVGDRIRGVGDELSGRTVLEAIALAQVGGRRAAERRRNTWTHVLRRL